MAGRARAPGAAVPFRRLARGLPAHLRASLCASCIWRGGGRASCVQHGPRNASVAAADVQKEHQARRCVVCGLRTGPACARVVWRCVHARGGAESARTLFHAHTLSSTHTHSLSRIHTLFHAYTPRMHTLFHAYTLSFTHTHSLPRMQPRV